MIPFMVLCRLEGNIEPCYVLIQKTDYNDVHSISAVGSTVNWPDYKQHTAQ